MSQPKNNDRIVEKDWGQSRKYKLRDWYFPPAILGRPIPLVYCDNCAKKSEGVDYPWF